MKHIIIALLALAGSAFGAANDLLIAQRNSTDTGQLTRLVAHPGGTDNGLVAFDGSTLLPKCILIGDGLVWSSGTLSVGMSSAMTTALAGKQDAISTGTTAQYYRGDKTWAAFPSIPAAQIQSDWTQASSGSSDFIKNKPNLGTAASQNSTSFATAAQGLKADTALQPAGNGSSLTGLTKGQVGLSNVDNTADLSKPISTATQTALNGKEPVISAGTTSQYWRGDKTWQTFPAYPVYSTTTQTRSFNSAFQVSTTKDSNVRYTVEIASSISLSGVNAGTVFLETSADNSNWVEESRIVNSQGGALVVGLSLNQTFAGQLSAFVPAGYWVRLRSVATSGTPTFTYRVGRETTLS